jgi:alkane 1-monooxygenase
MKPWVYFQLLILPAGVVAGNFLGGWYNYIVPAICFVIKPLYSILAKQKEEHHHDEHADYPSSSYRFVALTFVPILLGVTAFSFYKIYSTDFNALEFIGIVLSTGTMNGIIGFTLAHEFIHRFTVIDQLAGHLLLLQNNYLHYSVEHIGGHHIYACTKKDPHTARLNESFYRFLPRAVTYTFINAWEIESKRLRKRNYRFISIHNRMLLYIALHLLFATAVIWFAGWLSFIFLLLQGVIAIGLLHITNYLQHYGLLRKETESGQHEKVNTHHAWSSPNSKDGLSLFQLENHADHHMHPNRTYEQLSHHDDSPEQPTGYSGMILLALVPPVWFRIMNKRISHFHHQNQLT